LRDAYGFRELAGWIQREHGFGSPSEWIRFMAKGLRARSSQTAPPVDTNAILRACNIEVEFVPGLDVEGRLVCNDRGFVVLLNERLRRYGARARFTAAHELGHTLFYDRGVPKPRRRVPRYFNDAFEEHLCSTFAGELLIPFDYLSEVADGFQEKTEAEKAALLNEVASKCLVAREVAACHLVRTLGWWKSILIFTAEAGKAGLGDSTDRARRIIWSWHPPEFDGRLYIPGNRGAYPKIKIKELQQAAADAAHAPSLQSVRSKLLRIGNLSTVLDRAVGAEAEVWAVECSRPATQGSMFSPAQNASRHEVLLVIPVLAQQQAIA
jgi:hypothetical protein